VAPACGSGCAVWGQSVPHGALPSFIPESSGLAASHRHLGLLYTHNDSGDTPRFFAIDQNANVLAEMHLDGANALDWEDIAVGPCPAGWCVYPADIGDNTATRAYDTIYRVAEPATVPSDGSVVPVAWDSMTFVYPDGAHNAEALLVHPVSGRMFVIIKAGGAPNVYEIPQPFAAGAPNPQTLRKVATLKLPNADSIVTGGDFHPCGDRMLVRTVGGLYEFSAPGGTVDALFAATPRAVPFPAEEPQGEAVTYSLDGLRYFMTSETGDHPQPLDIVTCQQPQP
jgi:hypothetical protein